MRWQGLRRATSAPGRYLGTGSAPPWSSSGSLERCWGADPSAALQPESPLTARHLAAIGSASRHPGRIAEASCNAWSGPGCPVY